MEGMEIPGSSPKQLKKGGETCWVPNLTRTLPLAKPDAAMNANTIARPESLMKAQCSLEGQGRGSAAYQPALTTLL